jgi:hypothetical protein
MYRVGHRQPSGIFVFLPMILVLSELRDSSVLCQHAAVTIRGCCQGMSSFQSSRVSALLLLCSKPMPGHWNVAS